MKIVASLVMGMLGFFFVMRGKKIRSTGMMVLGGVLIVLSYWLF